MNYLNKKVTKTCPLCHSSDGLLLYRVDSLQTTRHFRLSLPDKSKYIDLKNEIELLWGQNNCEVVKCKECELTYASPYVAGTEKFYTLAYEREGYPRWKFEYEKSLEVIMSSVQFEGNGGQVLEIGAGDGAFLNKVAPKYIPAKNVCATEFSKYGIEKLQERGYRVINKDFRMVEQKEFLVLFDFIFLHQVLEHLDDLKGVFEKIGKISNKGAHLMIAVPNAEKIELNECNGALLDMPPNHVGRWTKTSFEVVAKLYNWKIIDVQIEIPQKELAVDKYLKYKFYKRSQKKHSLENLIATYDSRLINNRYFSVKRFVFWAYKVLTKNRVLEKIGQVGDSQWVHLQKN